MEDNNYYHDDGPNNSEKNNNNYNLVVEKCIHKIFSIIKKCLVNYTQY